MRRAALLPLGGALASLAALAAPFGADAEGLGFARLCLGGLAAACLWAGFAPGVGARPAGTAAVAALAALAGVAVVRMLSGGLENTAGPGFALALVAVWLSAWHVVDAATAARPRDPRLASAANLVAPVVFGLTVLLLWEGVVRGFGSSMMKVILPAPSAIAARFGSSLPTLSADFAQTFQGVSVGYALGCGSGILVAILIDRVPFLQRGLLPLGNLVSALPIVGMAPIMVMWFGFDWQSKAAIVVIMTFFPQLVNTVAGLASAGRMERDLMKTYAASYGQTLAALRLPSALPFIFNGLKINSTLALIGAIVAEFFGTPIVGMGFRINTEVGRMNIDMVWATILVSALTGSLFYGFLTLVERRVTFWHASYRQRTT
ncbi:ABC transporter permease [Alsobacter sp. SYSU M60028]|uniref:ABC transporter permease n=1 Tax=Alsobacter ponti TaxID=2962936 RepID=A0ABT1LHJ6_9HYPH|nr:ABC transporter permease [Alsobacter ponti]MCP8940588.1 ABC transporter permease [Alsobacter ponti]